MRIGLVDVDGHNYPNLPLMKLSSWHKSKGDSVEWYEPFNGLIKPYDIVYLSKVFSFTADYELPIYAEKVHRGGGVATQFIWRTGKSITTSQKTKICRMR